MGRFNITINGQTPSWKNSKQIVPNRKTHKPMIIASANARKWMKNALKQYTSQYGDMKWTGRYPVDVKIFFFRKDRRRFDYNNVGQAVMDFLVKAKIIEDDDVRHCRPVFVGWEVDKENPRVEVLIEEADNEMD